MPLPTLKAYTGEIIHISVVRVDITASLSYNKLEILIKCAPKVYIVSQLKNVNCWDY